MEVVTSDYQFRESFGDEAHDLVLPHHAEVVVREERERLAALGPAGVEDDGAGLGYPQNAAGEHDVAGVELVVYVER